MIEKQPSCDDVQEPQLLPVADAQRLLFDAIVPTTGTEQISLASALNRVLAQSVVSPMNVPAAANSAMDGYALHSDSIPTQGEATLSIAGSAWAGRPYIGRISLGECVRIFTGGMMPDGCDTVVIQEHVRVVDQTIDIDNEVQACKNVRQAGEDVHAGQEIFTLGRRIQAADIGVLASLGIQTVNVFKRLTVAYFTTGDELQSLETHPQEEPLPDGMLFDSNRYTLAAMLAGLDVDTVDLGIVRDNEADTRAALAKAAEHADLVVSSGGVSAGDADYVTQVFHEFGDVSFWKLAMRPGRPLAFGKVDNAAFFGLPGNPVAVMVTFLQFVQPAIRRMSGETDYITPEIPATCLSHLRKSPGRVEYQRGVMRVSREGELVVESTGKQGAGRLSSMSQANCLIVIAAEANGVEPGDQVSVQPFQGLLGN